MKHAGPAALDALDPLLADIRALALLKERGRGVFYRGGKAALHFHEDKTGLFADYRPAGSDDFTRLDVSGGTGRAKLMALLRSGGGS